ncbi:MAG: CvpA family protein [Planctomycetes bacterium]|nr:CvpA family protein [Planctomycetota bacterium]
MSPFTSLLFAFQDPASRAESASRFSSVDIACLVILLVATLLGARRGVWWQFVRLLGLLATLSVARALAPGLTSGLTKAISALSPEFANGLVWSVTLFAGLLIVGLVVRFGRLMIEGGELSGGERVGGALLGLASGAVLVTALFVCSSQLASQSWVEAHLRGSRAQDLVVSMAHAVPLALDPIANSRVTGEVLAAEPEDH